MKGCVQIRHSVVQKSFNQQLLGVRGGVVFVKGICFALFLLLFIRG